MSNSTSNSLSVSKAYSSSLSQMWYGGEQGIDSSFNKIVDAFAGQNKLPELYDFLRDTDQITMLGYQGGPLHWSRNPTGGITIDVPTAAHDAGSHVWTFKASKRR